MKSYLNISSQRVFAPACVSVRLSVRLYVCVDPVLFSLQRSAASSAVANQPMPQVDLKKGPRTPEGARVQKEH